LGDDERSVRLASQYFVRLAGGSFKQARQIEEAAGRIVRAAIREHSVYRAIQPIKQITDADLDRQADTDKPVKIVEKAHSSRGAITVPFATMPSKRYVSAPRARVMFDRILTPRFTKDIDELRVSDLDPRQLFAMLGRDMAEECDSKFIATCVTLLGAPGNVVAETGVIQWHEIDEEITQTSVAEAYKRYTHTGGSIRGGAVLLNINTFRDILLQLKVFDVVEPGIHRDPTGEGARWVVTERTDNVPDGALFMFGPPARLGRAYELEPPRVWFDRKCYILEFFAYTMLGGIIMSVGHVARVDFLKSRPKMKADKPVDAGAKQEYTAAAQLQPDAQEANNA
jgi:hypothetical protein